MLELYDPLWDKLGEHIPTMLSGLAASWDDEIAKSLLFDDLCHQETCYGATYAAIPHLLKIAEAEESRRQRREIAFFLGFERALRARPLPARPRRASGTARNARRLGPDRRVAERRRSIESDTAVPRGVSPEVQRKTAGAVPPERDQFAINVLMWRSAAEGWSFPIFAACCFRCLDLFKNICHTPRP
jgi:hypothetical protein